MPHEFSTSQWSEVASETNDVAAATRAAVAGRTHYITHVACSFSAATGGALTVEVRSGSTVLDRFEVPTGAGGIVVLNNYAHPLACAVGEAATVTVAAGGASVIGTVTIKGYSVQ